MKIRNLILSALFITATPLLSGCALFLVGAGVAAGIGAVSYANGELRVSEEASVSATYNATLKTMSDLQFKVVDQQKDALAGKIVSKRGDGTPVTVHLKQQTDKITEIRIRVGTFGDESLSKLIYDKIKKNL
jgi:hypothetical protein